ncbi:TPA: DUF1127 domain-containing protein [Yersinia enterocolitica]
MRIKLKIGRKFFTLATNDMIKIISQSREEAIKVSRGDKFIDIFREVKKNQSLSFIYDVLHKNNHILDQNPLNVDLATLILFRKLKSLTVNGKKKLFKEEYDLDNKQIKLLMGKKIIKTLKIVEQREKGEEVCCLSPADVIPSPSNSFGRLWLKVNEYVHQWNTQRKTTHALENLSADQLKDIGLNCDDIKRDYSRPFWR